MEKRARRSFMKRMMLLGALFAVDTSRVSTANNKVHTLNDIKRISPTKGLWEARLKARYRIRRIIVNNDGNDDSMPLDMPVNPTLFLNRRVLGLAYTQADTISYCDGIVNRYSHRSSLTEYPEHDERKMRTIRELERVGADPLSLVIDFCRRYNKEVFWSMRMNDTHDSTLKQPVERMVKYKQNHPEYMMAKRGEAPPPYGNGRWSALNYEIAEVREHILNIISDVVTRYDVDGVELDFFRHPVYFRSQCYDGRASVEDVRKMTQLVRDVRRVCDTESLRRGRPVLVGIRIPDSLGYCFGVGLDVETWLKEQLIDIMAGGCYFKLEPWENWVSLGQKYNVPVYASFENRRVSGGDPEATSDIKKWRGEALNAWKAGVNGIYTFNQFDARNSLFHELGDPLLLAKLDRIDQVSYAPIMKGVSSPEKWIKGGIDFIKEPKK